MDYPNVKNAHIVPRTYLANWAVGGKIAVWVVPQGKRLDDQPVENVGTRRRFYERERPGSGEKINDIEWSLGEGEAAATPLLRSFDETWPLSRDEKVQLAELFAYQLLRGPRWKAEYEERARRFIEEYESRDAQMPNEAIEKQKAMLLSDSYRFTRMFSTAFDHDNGVRLDALDARRVRKAPNRDVRSSGGSVARRREPWPGCRPGDRGGNHGVH